MSKSKVAKKKTPSASDKKQTAMKLVLSDTCAVCKTPCARGLRYWAAMKTPGAVGKGVPCILTRAYV